MKKKIFFKSNTLQYLWKIMHKIRLYILLKYKPEIIANKSFRGVFGRDINWENPTSLAEKIFWLQFNTDTSLWTKCADKYRVREYLEEKGCGEILNELYGKWDNPEDIEWDKLPESFVLKSNNGCGQIILVKNKRELNIPETTQIMKKWMKEGYGHGGAQLHYTRIIPCIIAEKLLVNKSEPDKAIIDYKIWCFHGKPDRILIISNRAKRSYRLSLYNTEWINISYKLQSTEDKRDGFSYGYEEPKPKSFTEMLSIARKLSADFTQVRVDLYEIDEKPIFGEMTFTSGFSDGLVKYYEEMGSKIDLSKVKKIKA